MVDIICYVYKDKHYTITVFGLLFVMYKLGNVVYVSENSL